jgi:hypothetical protein
VHSLSLYLNLNLSLKPRGTRAQIERFEFYAGRTMLLYDHFNLSGSDRRPNCSVAVS